MCDGTVKSFPFLIYACLYGLDILNEKTNKSEVPKGDIPLKYAYS